MHLWDKEFGTDYIKLNDYPSETRTMLTYGIFDTTDIITP